MRFLLPFIVVLSACSFPTSKSASPRLANADGRCEAGEVAVVATPVSREAKRSSRGVSETITCVASGPTVAAFVKETQVCGVKLELRGGQDAVAQTLVDEQAKSCRAARMRVPKAKGIFKGEAGGEGQAAGTEGVARRARSASKAMRSANDNL